MHAAAYDSLVVSMRRCISFSRYAIALSARCARDDPAGCLSPELVSGVEIRRAPLCLSDLPVAEVKHPDVLAVVIVITALRAHIRQRDGMIALAATS
jgi:hypothetical protein